MRFTIIISGDELIEGRQQDANGRYLAAALFERGFQAGGVVFVGDDHDELVKAFRNAMSDNDLVVCSGGLGGTKDDLTRFALAEAVASPLVENPDALKDLQAYWQRLNRPFPGGDKLEALMPAIAQMVPNGAGLAPGMFLTHQNAQVLCLPGVPTELRFMVENGALEFFGSAGAVCVQARIRVVNKGESVIAKELGDLLKRGRNPLCGVAAKHGEVVLSLRASGASEAAAQALIDADVRAIEAIIGANVYSIDGRDLLTIVSDRLKSKGQTLAVAESITGGLIGHDLTEFPGASDFFRADFVTYSDLAKRKTLAVDAKTLEAFGAVSVEVAKEMAEGARRNVDADFAISTTGIAGPTGGSSHKPVGTCCVAASYSDGTTWTEKRIHGGSRAEVKRRTVNHALDLLRRLMVFVDDKNSPK